MGPSHRAAVRGDGVLTTAVLPRRAAPFEPIDYALYGATIVAWSLSWYALAVQTRSSVSVEASLAYRFAIATLLMLLWVRWRGERMRFSLRVHARFAAMGVLIFSTNFLLFYYASAHLVSGLLAVMFSLASVFNVAIAFALTREPPNRAALLGFALGITGIVLMFLPALREQGAGLDAGALLGLGLCVAGTLCFCTGNVLSADLQRDKVPVIAASAWGMAYGTLWAAFLGLAVGRPFAFEWTAAYLVSLGWLAVVSTVIAFAAYLTLVGRIGAGRAGYATVIFPVFALMVSTAVEGYQWTVAAMLGLVLVLAGNVFVVRGR